jgi:2-polyprenyl-3-methyl-5-hydroxy-6-metoxy-1,4-benzoquinol methylase
VSRRRSVQELDLSLQIRADAALPVLERMPGVLGDLGCGTGCFAAEIARRGRHVLCVDVTQANLDALVRLYPELVDRDLLTPLHGDLTRIPLDTAALDGAFCMEVLEHVEDDRAAAAELARVVKPGGVLVVTVPNRKAPLPLVERLGLESVHDRPGPEHHVRPGYDARELTELLETAGFDVVSVAGVGGRLYRATTGAVSLAHLAYRKLRGDDAWTWADLERDATSLPMRIYGAVFPALLALARLDKPRSLAHCSTLVVLARREG